MNVDRRGRWLALGTALVGFACGGGGGGGTGPCTPGAATQLVKTSGDPAPWYFNNPLPAALSVTARDANNCPVPGVAITWAPASGGGGVTSPSTTNASGVATATDSIGSSSPQMVTATFAGLATPVTFTVTATAPPTSAAVTVNNNFFSPNAVVMQSGGTVTWTWSAGAVNHNVTYTSGPTPRPANTTTTSVNAPATFSSTISAVGTYGYACTNHPGMSGTVTVVH